MKQTLQTLALALILYCAAFGEARAQSSALCADCEPDIARRLVFWRVTSPALRDEVQAFLLSIGKRIPNTSFSAKTPLILGGKPRENGAFEIYSLRFGEALLTKRDINEQMSSGLREILEAPVSRDGGKRNYSYETMTAKEQQAERFLQQNAALALGLYSGKAVFRRLEYYQHAGFAVYEADSAVVTRLREALTPGLPRTPALDAAEQECSNSAEIKRLVLEGGSVPQSMIENGGNPQSCETVKNFYMGLSGLTFIGRTFIIADLRDSTPAILGSVSVPAPSKRRKNFDNLHQALNAPIPHTVFDADELRRFGTQQFEKDEVSVALAPVKGSIAGTSFQNLYDYCLNALQKGEFTDRTAEIMPFPARRKEFAAVLPPAFAQTAKKRPQQQPQEARGDTAMSALLQSSFGAPAPGYSLSAFAVCDDSLARAVHRALTASLGTKGATNTSKARAGATGNKNQKPELIVFTEDGRDVVTPFWIVSGADVFTKSRIKKALPAPLYERLSTLSRSIRLADGRDSLAPLYCHKEIPSLKSRAIVEKSYASIGGVSAKEALLRLPDFAHSAISLFEADWSATQRLREALTPEIRRTTALDSAERNCMDADEIRKRIGRGQALPPAMFQGKDSAACRAVQAYYASLLGFGRIERAYIVSARSDGNEKPTALGVVSLPRLLPQQAFDADFIRRALAEPLLKGVLTAEELAAIPTKEYEKNANDSVLARGSIAYTEATNMLEYLQRLISERKPHEDKIRHLRSSAHSQWYFEKLRQRIQAELSQERQK